MEIEVLTAAHMRKVGEAARTSGRSLSTANSAQRALNKMLVAALADGYRVPERFFAAKKSGAGKSSKRTSMSKQEVAATFTQAYAMHPDAVRLFLAVFHGTRAGEISGLHWVHLLFDPTLKPDAIVAAPCASHCKYIPSPISTEIWEHSGSRRATTSRSHASAMHVTVKPIAKSRETRKRPPNGTRNSHGELFGDAEYYLLHEARHSKISLLADSGFPQHITEMLVDQTKLVKNHVHGDMKIAAKATNDDRTP
ncbi:hypothetical protein [Changpingibacter yushuensis]|uniref:hypothetical protein n=1 Tax=Changpingibacter yushuensis TaxID=2758440 RepID=UPI0015F59CE8|nr:hypothetical protein [Changpingibacter yushuensis]